MLFLRMAVGFISFLLLIKQPNCLYLPTFKGPYQFKGRNNKYNLAIIFQSVLTLSLKAYLIIIFCEIIEKVFDQDTSNEILI